MPEIIVQNLGGKKIALTKDENLLKQIQEAGLDWMHACGGKGRCTTCKIQVMDGDAEFSEPTPNEIRYFEMSRLAANERLTCQAKIIKGYAEVTVPDSSKLPHVNYTDE